MKLLFILLSVGSFLLDHGASGADTVSVMEGDSVTLNTGVQKTKQDTIKWYYKEILIAHINGDQSKICTDVQCKDGDERFRDRLKLDHQTGSLTITHTRNTDSGEYTLTISGNSSPTIFRVSVTAAQMAQHDPKTVPGSGPSLGVAAGIVAAVLLLQLLV